MEGPIRHLMLPMLLIMWGGIYWLWTRGLLSVPLVTGIATAHVVCTVIFYNFIFVFNFGYATCMAVIPMIYAAAYSPPLPANLFLAMSVLYGLRLALFSWGRYRSESYAERTGKRDTAVKSLPLPLVIVIWLFLSALMFFVTFNAWVVASSDRINPTIWLAILVMLFGLGLEAIADRQKQDVKRINKDACCYIGLYKRIRHPNYLGEIIFHMGFYWGMISSTDRIYALALAGLGSGWVIAMMCSEAVYLDRKQRLRYGDSEEYEKYRTNSGLLLPKLF